MTGKHVPLHVSLVTLPETSLSALAGIHDVLNAFSYLGGHSPALPDLAPFRAEIVTQGEPWVTTASGLPVAGRAFGELAHTDIVLVPSFFPDNLRWAPGCFPGLVEWIARMHGEGAILASAGSGGMLLAETGLADGAGAAIPPDMAQPFRRTFPAVGLMPEQALTTAGARDEIIFARSTTAWHDLVLYLIARFAGVVAAQEIARIFALHCHCERTALTAGFTARTDHGDALVREAQKWLRANAATPRPVESVAGRSAAAASTFKRRFHAATGYSVLAYVQHLRIEDAKRRLETSDAPVEEIAWAVGYEDPAFFRRLFKRLTGVAPAQYRRRMRVPSIPDRVPAAVE